MKVIFIKNLPKVAKASDIKDQPDGYVRNFLLPKGYAVIATPEALKKLERAQNEVRVGKAIQTDLLKRNLEAIAGVEVTIAVKANEKGSLFQSIHARDIIAALKKEKHMSIEENFLVLPEPIKHAGKYTLAVSAMGFTEEIIVNVVATK